MKKSYDPVQQKQDTGTRYLSIVVGAKDGDSESPHIFQGNQI